MSVTDYILDGLIEYLELKRELGVKSVECDKSLLEVEDRRRGIPSASEKAVAVSIDAERIPRLQESAHHSPTPTLHSNSTPTPTSNLQPSTSNLQPSTSNLQPSTSNLQPSTSSPHFVFLHDRPLTPKAIEMMSKIIVALDETAETAPIIIEKPVPKVNIYVVLGGRALAKFMPGKKAGPGDWIKSDGGRDVLVTYSPEYILRFDGVSATTQQIKQSMWRSLKAVKQRLGGRNYD